MKVKIISNIYQPTTAIRGDILEIGNIYDVERISKEGNYLISIRGLNFYINPKDCEIIKENEMRKEDLKAGYTLEDEKGRLWFLVEDKKGLMGFIFKDYETNLNLLNVKKALNDDLTIEKKMYNPSCDIVRVYGLHAYATNILEGNVSDCELLWEHETPKKTITLELTEDQIENLKKQGFNVKS